MSDAYRGYKTKKQVIADLFWGKTAKTKVVLLILELKMQKLRYNW